MWPSLGRYLTVDSGTYSDLHLCLMSDLEFIYTACWVNLMNFEVTMKTTKFDDRFFNKCLASIVPYVHWWCFSTLFSMYTFSSAVLKSGSLSFLLFERVQVLISSVVTSRPTISSSLLIHLMFFSCFRYSCCWPLCTFINYIYSLFTRAFCFSEQHWTWGSFRLNETSVWDKVWLVCIFVDEPSWRAALRLSWFLQRRRVWVCWYCVRLSRTALSLKHCSTVVYCHHSPLS